MSLRVVLRSKNRAHTALKPSAVNLTRIINCKSRAAQLGSTLIAADQTGIDTHNHFAFSNQPISFP